MLENVVLLANLGYLVSVEVLVHLVEMAHLDQLGLVVKQEPEVNLEHQEHQELQAHEAQQVQEDLLDPLEKEHLVPLVLKDLQDQ